MIKYFDTIEFDLFKKKIWCTVAPHFSISFQFLILYINYQQISYRYRYNIDQFSTGVLYIVHHERRQEYDVPDLIFFTTNPQSSTCRSFFFVLYSKYTRRRRQGIHPHAGNDDERCFRVTYNVKQARDGGRRGIP